jgi:hypothetical protein
MSVVAAPLNPPPKRNLAYDVSNACTTLFLAEASSLCRCCARNCFSTVLDISPVREALFRLERADLVQVCRHRDAIIAQLWRTDAEEVYTLRPVIERLAVQHVVRHTTRAPL